METVEVEMYTVVYACNDGYAKLAGISLSSLLKNTASEIQAYIFNDKISNDNIEKLNSLKKDFHNLKELNFINVDSAIDGLKEYISGYDNALDKKSGGGYTAYARLLFEKFVPQNVDKILYLDCDTLVTGDISLLFTFDMRDFPIAMGYDCFTSKYLNIINFPKDSSYFNSGVFLVDTKKWKERKCLEILMKEVRKGISYPLVDQDFINICFKQQIIKLPFKYNFESQFFLYRSVRAISFIFGLKYFTSYKTDFEESQKNPVIYHFCGNTFGRPWFKNSHHPMKKVYDEYYFTSPWKTEEQKDYKLSLPYKIQYFLHRYTPKFVFYICSKIMQEMFYKITYGKRGK